MKKYVSHIIYLVIITFFVVYAKIKAKEAETMHLKFQEQKALVLEKSEGTDLEKSKAEAAAAEAVAQYRRAEEATIENQKLQAQLQACQGK